MKLGRNLLPWTLIASSVVIASMTYQHQANLKTAEEARLQPKRQPATAEQAKASRANQSTAMIAAPMVVRYQCDHQQMLEATYSGLNTRTSSVTLPINGQHYQLQRVHSQAGDLYATAQGVNPGQGMRWHVQGLEARLVTMQPEAPLPGQTAIVAKEQLLLRCQQPV